MKGHFDDKDLNRNLEPDRDFLNSIDPHKLKGVFQKSLIWIILILVTTNLGAYLFIRYTKPLFQSSSEIKLDVKSEASLLGIKDPTPDYNNLSGEIELIKSNLFFGKVVDLINMDVSYYSYGNILTEERYKTSPFKVEYNLRNANFYDRKFDIDIKDDQTFTIDCDGTDLTKTYHFGEKIENDGFDLVVNLKHFHQESTPGRYYFTINSDQAVINYFKSNLQVVPINLNARTIRISFKDHNAYKARDLVNAIDTIYLNYTQEEKNKATRQQIEFINHQLSQTEQRLEEYEDYFEDFTIDNKTTDLETDIGKTIELMEEIDQEKYDLQSKLIIAVLLEEKLGSGGPIAINPRDFQLFPANILSSLEKLNQLIQEKEMLLGSHNENTYVISKKEQEIAFLESRLSGLLNNFKEILGKEIKILNKERLALESNFKELPSLGTEYSKNKRFYSLYEGFYLSQIQKKAEFEIAQAGTVTNFVILSPADLPLTPIHPQKASIYGIGIVSGLILGFLFVLIRYLIHNKISSPMELENLTSASFLGTVPHAHFDHGSGTKLVVDKNPKSALSESLRSIRTNMEFLGSSKMQKVITITSTIQGEGKTFISVNLGAIVALSKAKVILVDLDMRKPKLHAAFSQENDEKGVSTILINKHSIVDCIRTTGLDNLYYIPAGPTPPNPSELILSDEFSQMLENLKNQFDLVIFDTPPVGIVTDGILAMKISDLPIYIVRANYSQRNFTKNINRLIEVNKFTNLSVILNSLKTTTKGYGNVYGYQSGYYEEKSKPKKKLSILHHLFSLK